MQKFSIRGNLPAKSTVHITASGKGGKRNQFSLITPNPILSMHKHVHSEATYLLRVYQFTTQQVGKGGKRIFILPIMSIHKTCSFKGKLPSEGVPVHNTASG